MSDLFDYNLWPGPPDEDAPDHVLGARKHWTAANKPKPPDPITTYPVVHGSSIKTTRLGEEPERPLLLRPSSITVGAIPLRNGFSIQGVTIEGRVPNRSLTVYVGDYIKIPVDSGIGGRTADQVYTVVETSLTSDPGGYTEYRLTIRPHDEGSTPV